MTDETNTAAQKSDYIAAVLEAMQELLGDLYGVSYIHIHEARAGAWGYGGRTQQHRAMKRKLERSPLLLMLHFLAERTYTSSSFA